MQLRSGPGARDSRGHQQRRHLPVLTLRVIDQ